MLFFILALSFIFASCNEKAELKEGLIGKYIVLDLLSDTLELTNNMSLNIMKINPNGSVELPKIVDRFKQGIKKDTVEYGKWALTKMDLKAQNVELEIQTNNAYFKGVYNVLFDKNEKGNINLILRNKRTIIITEKRFFNYTAKQSFINKLIKYTNNDPTQYKAEELINY